MLKITVLLLAFVVLITGCIGGNATLASVTTEEYTIYEAVIESIYLVEGIELIVIQDHTATDVSPSESLDNELKYVQDNLGPAIESETLNDYKAKNRRSRELAKSFPLDVEYALLSEVEFNEIFKVGGGWAQFYETYPRSQGLMTLSSVGFNAKMDQALVYVGNQADYLAGRGYYVFLTKKGGAWAIQNMIVAWVS